MEVLVELSLGVLLAASVLGVVALIGMAVRDSWRGRRNK